jgi:Arc/MetJ-type ribon-helix-helix transcriptional regulator
MTEFNYNAPAELFPSRNRKIVSKVKYRRFDKAADAIRFAVEELPESLLLGATIQLDDQRLGHQEIRALYDSEQFPHKKPVKKPAKVSAKAPANKAPAKKQAA